MGQRLKDFYDEAVALGQAKARMRLAIITKVSSAQAEKEPDSAENIAKFAAAIAELKKEFGA